MSIGCDDDVKKKTNNDNVNNTNNAVCGNDLLEAGETCDGTDLGGEDCTTIDGGFTGGTLACAAGCGAFDTSGCTAGCTDACTLDARVCNGDTLRVCVADTETGCTVWDDTDCTATSESCQVIEEVAQCAACVDACTLNDTRCNAGDNGIETCVLGGAGCTVWSNAPCDAATPLCELQAGEPTCVSDCTDACTLDAKQCNTGADGIETCVTGASGCTEWQNDPCDVATPECQDLAGTPTCLAPNGSGESCSDVYVISVPFFTEGADFTADYANDFSLSSDSCDTGWTMNGADVVLAVDLTQDEAIVFAQGGGVDAAIYIQAVCDAAGECLDVVDDGYSNDVELIQFTAPADGVYYLIVKGWSASPTTVSYAIGVWHYESPAELTCDDGFDNDLDGTADCDDSDCFGVGPCTTELNCGDGLDNDNDGLIDCEDAIDCGSIEPCGTEDTEARCADGIDNDNNGLIDCEETACFGLGACGDENTEARCADGIDNDNNGDIDCFDAACNGVGACGSETTEDFCGDGLDNDADGLVDCFDDDCASTAACEPGESCVVPLTVTLPFVAAGSNFGLDYDNNHLFTNTANGCGTASGGEGVFAVELVAGQQIRMDETGALDAVIRVMDTCTDVNPTCLLSEDAGTNEVGLLFTAPADGTYYVILEAYYASTSSAYNFSIFTVTADETGLCDDGLDNDNDGLIDCNDADCFGAVGACETELNCNDGNDNDGDTFVDCDDTDCAGAMNCLGGDSCADALPVMAFPYNVTGADITVDFANDHTFSSATCTVTGGVEAVFSVALLTGQRIRLNQTGTMDAQLRVLPECTTTAPVCLINSDPETNIVFTAPADGTYFVVLETWSTNPSSKGYNFTIDLIPDTETTCDDGVDEDLDGTTDCADLDCDGVGHCGAENTEAFCADGLDNDGDGDLDCADADCTGVGACGPENTDAACADTIDNDADGLTDCADPDCYGHPGCPSVIFSESFDPWPPTGWTIENGSSDAYTWMSSADMPSSDIRALNGSTGLFALVDSDAAGSGVVMDEYLVSPAIDCTGFSTITLSFRHYYYHTSGQIAQVDVSTDAGATWTNVVSYTASTANGAIANIDISTQAAGQASVHIRWHFADDGWDWYWLIDDVVVLGQ